MSDFAAFSEEGVTEKKGSSSPSFVRQVGFCLVCGNSIHEDEQFEESDRGMCHSTCL